MTMTLTQRQSHIGLVFLLLFFLAWDMRAVVADNRLGPTDTTVEEAIYLLSVVGDEGISALPGWCIHARKGPMAGLLVALVGQVVDDLLLASRLLSVMLHALLLVLLFRMAVRLTGVAWSGLLAVVICGTFPGEYGWFRMEYHESLLTLFTMLTLDQLAGDLKSPRRAALLGLTMAGGILSKVPFPLFIIGPGLVFLWRNLRDRRALANAALAAGTFALTTGWYLVPNLLTIAEYVDGSHEPQSFQFTESLRSYFLIIPGTIPYLTLALLAAPLVWRLEPAQRALTAGLAASICTGVSLLLYFDPWARYLVPAFPMAGLLITLGMTAALRRLAVQNAAMTRTTLAVMAAALLSLYVLENMRGIEHPEGNREWGTGLIKPDRRQYMAYPLMVRHLLARTIPVYSLGWTSKIEGCPDALRRMWNRRGIKPKLLLEEVLYQRLAQSKPVHVLLCHRELAPLHGLSKVEAWDDHDVRILEVVKKNRPRPLKSFSDPDGVRITLLWVGGK